MPSLLAYHDDNHHYDVLFTIGSRHVQLATKMHQNNSSTIFLFKWLQLNFRPPLNTGKLFHFTKPHTNKYTCWKLIIKPNLLYNSAEKNQMHPFLAKVTACLDDAIFTGRSWWQPSLSCPFYNWITSYAACNKNAPE